MSKGMELSDKTKKRLEEYEALKKQNETSVEPSAPKPEDTKPNVQPALPVPAATPAPEEKREDWKAKFLSLNGRIESVSSELTATRRENGYLREQNGSLLSKLESALKAQPATVPKAENILSEKEREEYGTEFENILTRQTEKITKMAHEAVKSVQEQAQRAEAKAEQSAQVAFSRDLKAIVPDWVKINESAEWKTWLLKYETAEQNGKVEVLQRNEFLQRKAQSLDAEGVAEFFRNFVEDTGYSNSTVTPAIPSAIVPLASQVAPLSRGTTVDPNAPTRKVVKQEDYLKFVSNQVKGFYRNKPMEEIALEKMFAEALREGRLVA